MSPTEQLGLTLVAFRAWLESQSESSIISTYWGAKDCPIAKFMQFTRPDLVDIKVGSYCLVHSTERISVVLPDWAQRFISRLDNSELRTVTREDCLRILDNLS
jgi:hypothetical protein